MDRIATFLEEDEVTDQVSTLKRSDSGLPTLDGDDDKGLGIENGSFKWNEVEENDNNGPNANGTVSDDTAASEDLATEELDHHFELKDINVKFPEGQLSLITGPTASGKTALLVSTTALYLWQFLYMSFSDGASWGDDASSWWANNYVKEPFKSG